LLDNGNLVVLEPGRVLWQSRTVIDLDKPTIRHTGRGRYSYDETGEMEGDVRGLRASPHCSGPGMRRP
jgi:hypothetical protein